MRVAFYLMILGCYSLLSTPALALNLLDAYALALDNDPSFHAALKARDAGRENLNIGRAALLPKINYSYNKARNDSDVTQSTTLGNFRSNRRYKSYSSSFNLQQPLFDYAAWAEYRQGVARALMADESFRARTQELAVRLFNAYSEALLSEKRIALSQAQKRAYTEQLALNKRLFRAGEGTRTDILETEARLQLSQAENIEALDSLDAALRELQTIIGSYVEIEQLAPLQAQFKVKPLLPRRFEVWRDLSVRHNAELGAQRQALEVAGYEVKRKRANHLPSVSLYANSRKTSSDSESSYNQKYDTNSVGIQVSLPLFAGGGNLASTRQASRQKEQAQYELDDQVGKTIKELRKQYNLINSSQARIHAFELAVKSATTLVTATQKSVLGGERVNLDVLNAQQQLYSVHRDLIEAQYAYLKAWVQLKYLSGKLDIEELQELNSYFSVHAL